MSENKRFLLERSDYDLKYEFRIADLSRVDKTKEDFWDEEEEEYNYRGIDGFLDYLYDNNAFLTQDEADKILNELHNENEELKSEKYIYDVVKNRNEYLIDKLKKEEEKNGRLIKMLDNVANYMQKQHKDIPIDDFVEWWNNLATEGLE